MSEKLHDRLKEVLKVNSEQVANDDAIKNGQNANAQPGADGADGQDAQEGLVSDDLLDKNF